MSKQYTIVSCNYGLDSITESKEETINGLRLTFEAAAVNQEITDGLRVCSTCGELAEVIQIDGEILAAEEKHAKHSNYW